MSLTTIYLIVYSLYSALWDLTPLFAEKIENPYMDCAPSVLNCAHLQMDSQDSQKSQIGSN